MSKIVQINARGTMTLPKALRKMLGVDKGGVVIASEAGAGFDKQANPN